MRATRLALLSIPQLVCSAAFAETDRSATSSTATLSPSRAVLGVDELDETPPDDRAERRENVVEEIEVSADRVAEAARPDTTLRLTGKQLEERGVTNLAQAIDLIGDALVRSAGRGGSIANLRGGRKGAIMIIMDGVPISEPFTGNFDITSIPATDIAEIRLSLTPASPLDGPGGDAGVIEVITYAASGPRRIRAQAQASDAPGGFAAVSGRAEIGAGVHARVSGGATVGDRAYDVTLPGGGGALVREDARAGNAGLRFERRSEVGGLAADFGVSRRKFFIPPGDDPGAQVQLVNREDLFRAVISGETRIGQLLLSGRAFSLIMERDATSYQNASFIAPAEETTFVHRTGGALQADYAATPDLRFTQVTHLVVEGGHDVVTGGALGSGASTVLEPAGGFFFVAADWLAIDGAVGPAIPLGISAKTWPEAKLTATFTATRSLQVKLTGARKGRVPTVRERFAAIIGNPALKPEMGSSAEATVLYRPARWLVADVAAYFRRTEDLISLNQTGTLQVNRGDIDVYGLEAKLEAYPWRWAGVGAAYVFAQVASNAMPGKGGTTGLDNFPQHRAEVWTNLRWEGTAGLWGRARYTGEVTDQGHTLGAYATLDAALWTRIDTVQISLRGENLTNTAYQMRANVPGFSRTIFLGLLGTIE
jgi:hypothetical protein